MRKTCLYRLYDGSIYHHLQSLTDQDDTELILQFVHLTTITGQCEDVTTPEVVLPGSIRLIPEIPLVPNTIKLALLFSAYSTIAFVTEPTSQITSVCTFNFLADASCFTSSTIFCPYCFARSKISLDFMLGGTI